MSETGPNGNAGAYRSEIQRILRATGESLAGPLKDAYRKLQRAIEDPQVTKGEAVVLSGEIAPLAFAMRALGGDPSKLPCYPGSLLDAGGADSVYRAAHTATEGPSEPGAHDGGGKKIPLAKALVSYYPVSKRVGELRGKNDPEGHSYFVILSHSVRQHPDFGVIATGRGEGRYSVARTDVNKLRAIIDGLLPEVDVIFGYTPADGKRSRAHTYGTGEPAATAEARRGDPTLTACLFKFPGVGAKRMRYSGIAVGPEQRGFFQSFSDAVRGDPEFPEAAYVHRNGYRVKDPERLRSIVCRVLPQVDSQFAAFGGAGAVAASARRGAAGSRTAEEVSAADEGIVLGVLIQRYDAAAQFCQRYRGCTDGSDHPPFEAIYHALTANPDFLSRAKPGKHESYRVPKAEESAVMSIIDSLLPGIAAVFEQKRGPGPVAEAVLKGPEPPPRPPAPEAGNVTLLTEDQITRRYGRSSVDVQMDAREGFFGEGKQLPGSSSVGYDSGKVDAFYRNPRRMKKRLP